MVQILGNSLGINTRDRGTNSKRKTAKGSIAVLCVILFLTRNADVINKAYTSKFGNVSLTPAAKEVDSNCLATIAKFLTAQEKASSLDTLLCSPENSLLADTFREDRSKIRTFERKAYLKDLRSYRISGLICNDHLDPTIPPVSSEPAFKCLPKDYKRRACMDGNTSFPGACSKFGGASQNAYVPEPERGRASASQESGCDSPGVKCAEAFMGKKGSSISPGQLAKGVAEAEVLTTRSDGRPLWRPEALDLHLQMIREGGDVSPIDYPGAQKALQKALDAIKIKKMSVAIFGSISPWVESIVHYNGAKVPIITVDYNQPKSFDERLQTELMTTMLENEQLFEVVVSYSSIEHDGQGRYGDPLDPDGDLVAMKEVWLKVAPGGIFLLNVPFGPIDSFYWHSMRIYGPSRLPVLIRGWEYVGVATPDKLYGSEDSFSLKSLDGNNNVIILRKPASVGIDEVLDTTKFGGLECDKSKTECKVKQRAL